MKRKTPQRTIVLMTDFGTRDVYVGVMKSVILSIAPDATIIDLTHEVPPQDIFAGAMALQTAVQFAPEHSVHVAIVDPGVGTGRSEVAIEINGRYLVGPDNGLLSLALSALAGDAHAESCRACRLTNAKYHLEPVSSTFHGRDIFAPVAAHVALGVALGQLGEAIPDPQKSIVQIHLPEVEWNDAPSCRAEVLTIDHFGNLVTNLRRDEFVNACEPSAWQSANIHIAGAAGGRQHTIHGIHTTYGSVDVNQPVAYFGSSGWLEIAVRNASAAETFRTMRGDAIEIEWGG